MNTIELPKAPNKVPIGSLKVGDFFTVGAYLDRHIILGVVIMKTEHRVDYFNLMNEQYSSVDPVYKVTPVDTKIIVTERKDN